MYAMTAGSIFVYFARISPGFAGLLFA